MSKVESVKKDAHSLLKALKNRKKSGGNSLQSDIPFFSMEDVRQVLVERENEQREQENRIKIQNKQKLIEKTLEGNKNTVVSVAGIADILGFNPMQKVENSPKAVANNKIDPECYKYYVKLLQLKGIIENKSAVSLELEFAWSMLKNESNKGKEIKDAIDRIENKTYGICEITGEKIAEERLATVPFTRYSVRGQREFERRMLLKKEKQNDALFGDETENVFGESYDESE